MNQQNHPMDPNVSQEHIYRTPDPEHDLPNAPEPVMHGEDTSILRFPDGSVVVGPQDDEQAKYPNQAQPNRHEENLALILDENELRDIGNSLKDAVEEDIGSQEAFYEAVANAIQYMGLTLTSESDKDDLPFKGASSIYSSALFETLIDIVASAKSALFPTSGMVDTVVLGDADDHLQDIAYRKKAFFNYYFDVVCKEFRKEAIRTIFWAALSGSVYKKVYICPVLGRPVSNFIPIEDFVVNREHSSHIAASRKTHILRIDEREFDIRVMTGMYRDINIMKQEDRGDESQVIKEQLDAISGYDGGRHNADDAGYTLYECHVDYRIKGDPEGAEYDIPLPYIVTLDEKSSKVLRIVRNWNQNDFLKKKTEYFVNYSLLPSLDGEGYGMVNYAGRLAEAATSITRQLINSGTYANFPGGVYQAGIRIENNNLRPAPGEFVPIQTGGLPVGQAIEALPYKEPSSALHDLKNEIEDCIRKPSAIINNKISEMAPRAAEGSVLAMFENLQKVPNAILQNLHESFSRELELFNDRFAEWLPVNQPYPFMVPGGKHVIMKEDFESDIQVMPSSDPSTQNSTHRFLLSEIVINNAKSNPDVHNMQFAFKYFYKNLGLSEEDIQQLLTPKDPHVEETPPMDPVSTIMAITQGQPVNAAVWQDHDAYITILDAWMQANAENPNLAAAQALKAQHEAYKYLVDVYAKMNMPPPEDPTKLTPEQQNQLAVAVAHIKTQEAEEAAKAAGPPPEPPMDPAKVMLEDAQMKHQIAQEKNHLDGKKIELEMHKLEMDYALKEQEFHLKSQIQNLKQETDSLKLQLDFLKEENDLALKERDQVMKENTELHNQMTTEMHNQVMPQVMND